MQNNKNSKDDKPKKNLSKKIAKLIDKLLVNMARVLLVAYAMQGIYSVIEVKGDWDLVFVIPLVALLAFKSFK